MNSVVEAAKVSIGKKGCFGSLVDILEESRLALRFRRQKTIPMTARHPTTNPPTAPPATAPTGIGLISGGSEIPPTPTSRELEELEEEEGWNVSEEEGSIGVCENELEREVDGDSEEDGKDGDDEKTGGTSKGSDDDNEGSSENTLVVLSGSSEEVEGIDVTGGVLDLLVDEGLLVVDDRLVDDAGLVDAGFVLDVLRVEDVLGLAVVDAFLVDDMAAQSSLVVQFLGASNE